jgi:hypothetical protein
VADAVRPQDHTALSATGTKGPTCTGAPRQSKPLIVDLDPDARVSLEAAMKRGVVVVAYDCTSFRVLPTCKVPEARYEYAGVSRKEQVIQMNSQDDLNVNLPISSGKLGAEMKSGRSVDLALVRVGMTSTALGQITRAELVGGCDGATHFVQNATLGAFSLATGSVGKAGAVAEMFGVGGAAKSESERKAMTKDGSLDDCRKSDPDGAAPPAECRSPLQVDLFPVLGDAPTAPTAHAAGDPKSKKDEKAKTVEAAENDCPAGYSFADGICTRGATQAHLCDSKNKAECTEQCDKGNAESCLNLGRIENSNPAVAIPLYKKACAGGSASACGAAGLAMMPDDYKSPTVAAEARLGLAFAEQGCDGGDGRACNVEGDYQEFDDFKIKSFPAAMKAYARGCTLGYGESCFRLAKIHFEATDVPRDGGKGLSLLNKSCQAGNADECGLVAAIYEMGRAYGSTEGVTADPEKAFASFKRACLLDATWCERSARGALTAGKDKDAFAFAERGCGVGVDKACYVMGTLYESGKGTSADAGKARAAFTKGCDGGDGAEDACKKIGVEKKSKK